MPDPVVIFLAASLAGPFEDVGAAFKKKHPGAEILAEASASRVAARKVSELHRAADLVAAADLETIPRLLMPRRADWALRFVGDRLALIRSPRSRFAAEVSSENWPEVLLRPGVRFGVSRPDVPVGYRALLCWKLAELRYKRPGLYDALKARLSERDVRPDAAALLALLESGELDYVFDYESLARRRRLPFTALPPEVNLGDPRLESYYARAEVEIPAASRTPGDGGATERVKGSPVAYAITILKDAPHRAAAAEFLRFLLGPEGRKILERDGLTPVVPPVADGPGSPPKELAP